MRIALAEDEALFRQGLSSLLRSSGHEIVLSAADADELVVKVAKARPDLIITDIRMPPTHTSEGLTAAIDIRQRIPDVAIVLLSHHVDAQGTIELLAACRHRIGYLLKQRVLDFEMFNGVLERVQSGGPSSIPRWCPPSCRHDAGDAPSTASRLAGSMC